MLHFIFLKKGATYNVTTFMKVLSPSLVTFPSMGKRKRRRRVLSLQREHSRERAKRG